MSKISKVALLAGKRPQENASLAIRLARHGNDIAIIYRVDLGDAATLARQTAQIRAAVEATGQHCLLLPADALLTQHPQQLVQHVVDKLGRLDFFVCRSMGKTNGRFSPQHNGNGSGNGRFLLSSILPQHQLMVAAMRAIINQPEIKQ